MKEQLSNFYDFSAKNLYENDITLEHYKNKVLLVINIAFKCTYSPQLFDMQSLIKMFPNDEFAILAFPSDNFDRSERLNNENILNFCIKKNNFDFDIFSKINVKGEEIHPLYAFMRKKSDRVHVSAKPLWNFHKYLINKKGEVVDYYYAFTKPTNKRVIRKIEKCLTE